jgi:AAA domain/RepB DNA-primase N-terminal domain
MLDPGRISDADVRPSPSEAVRFLAALQKGAKFTFQTFDDDALREDKSLALIRHGTLMQHWPELVQLNNRGAGIFVTVNATDLKGRTKDNVIKVRALFVDLDGAPLDPVTTCSTPPHIVVESSPGRWHCYWLVCDVPLEAFKPMQKALAARFNGDESVSDLPRVLRLPGFVHRKAEPFLCWLQDLDPRPPYTFEQMRAAFPPAPEPEPRPAPQSDGSTERKRGQAWAQAALTASVAELTQAGEGARHKTLLAKAVRMGTMIARGWIDRHVVRRALYAAAESNGQIKKYGIGHFDETFDAGVAHGILDPHPDLPDDPPPSAAAPPPNGPAPSPPSAKIVPGPFVWRDPATLPTRQWLYRRHLIRKFVSATVGPGGGGKSKLSITDMLAMTTGKNLCDHNIGHEKLRVWLWNLEDPAEEIERRIHAACQHFGIGATDIGNRLFFNSGRDMPCLLATHSLGRGATIVRPTSDEIAAAIRDLAIDVLVIDPWVSCHRVPENDNGAIDLVVKEWGRIADAGNCAIDLYAHTRKLAGEDVTTEAARGGKSLTDGVRAARVMNRMSETEALKAGVNNRRLHFRMFGDKLNLAPPADDSDWYRIVDVALPNGDQVGVVERWFWPSPLDGVTARDLLAVQKLIAAEPTWREDVRAKKWAGKAVAEVLKLDLAQDDDREKAKGCLAIWIKNGALTVVLEQDEKRMERSFVRVGGWADE